MLIAGGKAECVEEAAEKLENAIRDGSALEKLAEFVEAQGGDRTAVYQPEKLPQASIVRTVAAPGDGYVNRLTCDEVGICSLILGAGRETKESAVDLSAGLVLRKKAGDYVKAGEPLAELHGGDERRLKEAEERFLGACVLSDNPPEKSPLIKGVIS